MYLNDTEKWLYLCTYAMCHVVQSHDKMTPDLVQQGQQLKNKGGNGGIAKGEV